MKTFAKTCRVAPKSPVDLSKIATRIDPVYSSMQDYEAILADHVARLSSCQERLYAAHRHAVLIVFQAMDTAGKDGCIKHVMSGVNPQGCNVTSFSHPAPQELRHDFLWRTTRELPERGMIGIFNRSYYEEVLILRVHPELLQAEAVPDVDDVSRLWNGRYKSIKGLERHLHRNGTRVLKFFLHISKEEQRKRLLDRIVKPEKHWKIQLADILERRSWKQYQHAYEACLSATSINEAPWHIIPADDKPNARLIVSSIILDLLENLPMEFPKLTPERRKELNAMRRELEAE